MKEKRARNNWWTLLRWLVPLGLIAFLLSQVNWQEILPLLAHVSWMSLAAAFLFFLLSQFIIAVRWDYLLRAQQIQLPLARLTWLVLIGAFASIQPPASLRDSVLAAMDRTATRENAPVPISIFRRLAVPLAAAAGIALAFLVTRPASPTAVAVVAKSRAVPVEVVQAGFVKTFESPSFDLEEKREDHQMLARHLREKDLPCPGCLPPGLQGVKGIGCRELVIDGKKGSLVCFQTGENGIVHMVIFRREDVSGDFPSKGQPVVTKSGKWTTARWEDAGKVFLIMSDAERCELSKLF